MNKDMDFVCCLVGCKVQGSPSKSVTIKFYSRFCFFNLDIEEVVIQKNGVPYCQILPLLCLLPGMQHSDSNPASFKNFDWVTLKY